VGVLVFVWHGVLPVDCDLVFSPEPQDLRSAYFFFAKAGGISLLFSAFLNL
jgi:hypothetical protein